MESIGERLRAAREARKISIKDVAGDTNISPMYIEALEEENFDKFPGDTYLIGFLRAYAEYLKLDSNEIIQSYRGFKIGESATPLEELTRPTRQSIGAMFSGVFGRYRNIVMILGVAVAAFFLMLGIKSIFSSGVDVSEGSSIERIKNEYNAKNIGASIENIRNLQLHNDQGFVLVYVNEAVQFLVDKKEIVFLLKEVKTNSVTIEVLPGKLTETLEMGKTVLLNIPDSPREVKLTLKGLTEKRAKLMVELGAGLVVEKEKVETPQNPADANADNTSVIAINKKSLKIVFEATFTQKSFFEIYLDGNKKYSGFINPGTHERWEAGEFIQVKAGNAGGISAKINGREYAFGKAGQVVNKMITWKKDVANPNLYHIVLKDQ